MGGKYFFLFGNKRWAVYAVNQQCVRVNCTLKYRLLPQRAEVADNITIAKLKLHCKPDVGIWTKRNKGRKIIKPGIRNIYKAL